ncbi:GntR family transcriptional regulator [uncultured Kocuria sp.]|uniref:GntR family transcriptional regulator n=1 Tax=uncultured Kocuria sp. TaxID=259305 RepID=UPI00260DA73A|nr:GntR family transcriptional regulator [uncultured Kocuria sp.]
MLQHTDETTGGGRSLADQAFLRLQDRLILLDIPPGSPLNEARLSEDLGVGRTPLREALKRLESEHLVVTYPRRGTFATTVDITALSEISQVREVLEPLAARLAAERHGGAARERLERLRGQLEDPAAGDREDTLRWDVAIHRAVYAAAGNAHLETTLTRYGNLATRIWCVAADRIPQLQEHISVHTALLTAVLEGRSDEAATIMLEHIRDFEEQVRRVL